MFYSLWILVPFLFWSVDIKRKLPIILHTLTTLHLLKSEGLLRPTRGHKWRILQLIPRELNGVLLAYFPGTPVKHSASPNFIKLHICQISHLLLPCPLLQRPLYPSASALSIVSTFSYTQAPKRYGWIGENSWSTNQRPVCCFSKGEQGSWWGHNSTS